jgi:pilus assembly protein CpaC
MAKKSILLLFMVMLMAAGLVLASAALDEASAQTHSMELQSGETRSFTAEHPLKRVVIGDPDVVHVEVTGRQDIYMVGRKIGQTKVTLKGDGLLQTTLDILVTPDVTNLKRRISELFPGQDIKVYTNYTGVVLTGTVTGAEVIEQVLRLAQQILGTPAEVAAPEVKISESVKATASRKEMADILSAAQNISTKEQKSKGASKTGTSGPAIVNLLKVGGPQQVLLEVKFAEVNRNSTRELEAGIGLGKLDSDFSGGASSSGSVITPVEVTGFQGVAAGGKLGTYLEGVEGSTINTLANAPGSLYLNLSKGANLFVNIDNFTMMLRFLEEERLGRVLAEPKLVTMSGQEASFLAGGEFPYTTVNANGQTDTEFKDFGIGLRFTPIVGSDGMITLKVAPSVSDIADFIDSGVGGTQAFFSTRKLESMVQLRDGQTLALAGLLQDNLSETVSKIPLLGDIPILGALFRSTNYQHKKTDLLVAVTPHLVQPVQEGKISFPGEFIKAPNRFEFYLEGKLEGRRSGDDPSLLSQHAFVAPADAQGGLEGNFGHMESAR